MRTILKRSCHPCAIALCLASALIMAGCMVGPKYHPPSPPTPAAQNYKESSTNFQDTQGWKVASPQEAMLRGKWWEVFNDAELNALEEQVNINNQNIKEYFQNLMEARAVIREARAQFWPAVTTSPSWQRTKASSNLRNTYNTAAPGSTTASGQAASSGLTTTVWSFPVDISWVPDFW